MHKGKPYSEGLGEILGFGTSLFIFTSIFYFVLSRHPLPSKIFTTYNFTYSVVIIVVMMIYAFSLILRGLIKK